MIADDYPREKRKLSSAIMKTWHRVGGRAQGLAGFGRRRGR